MGDYKIFCEKSKELTPELEVMARKQFAVSFNPYWENIEKLAEKQRLKGLSKYNRGLEDNPLVIEDRLTYLQEELIDGLMYIEHIKSYLKEGEHDPD